MLAGISRDMTHSDGKPPPIPARALRDPLLLLATGLGTGLARRAPGTWGTLPGVALAWALHQLLTLPRALAVLVLLAVLGVPLCQYAGRRLGASDHGGIVYDEVVGYAVAALLLPFSWLNLLLVFLTFRLFDIWKPWPIGLADRRLHGGLGVMVDDLLAGLAAALVLWPVTGLPAW